MKKIFLLGFLFYAISTNAQNLFWTFDDNQQPMTIAPECDAKFDEVMGGVFMPVVEDVYHYGAVFLDNQSYDIKRQAPYCFLVAAFNGHAEAQLKLARMYNKGDVLPQDDLSAYKWAFISALSGNKAAEDFVLALEPFIATDDLEILNGAIEETRSKIEKQIAASQQKVSNDSSFDGIPPVGGLKVPAPTEGFNIFSEEDRF